MLSEKNNKYIITGGPGSGKTTLLDSLKNEGFTCVEEASRPLIIEEVARQSNCLPWTNLSCFAQKALTRMTELYTATLNTKSVTFFDRGIPDIVAYLRAASLQVQENYTQALQQHPYNVAAFILPPWKEIYLNDNERWHTYEEAEAIYFYIKETYQSLGFTLIELPKTTVNERKKLVLKNLLFY